MVYEFFKNLKKTEKGISLIEIIVVIFVIGMLSLILVSDFPKIQRQYALSSVTYKLAQDLRKVEDMGLSGVTTKDMNGQPIAVKGYGIYINLITPQSKKEYIIYADVNNDQKYNVTSVDCDKVSQPTPLTADCNIEIVDISKQNPNLRIKQINNISGAITSINFRPPNPDVSIENLSIGYSKIEIILTLTSDPASVRTIQVNTSGLINVIQ